MGVNGAGRVTDAPQRVVMSTTISRTVHQFYGDLIDAFQRKGYIVHVVTSPGPEVDALRLKADELTLITMRRDISLLHDARALWRWILLLKRLRPDVVFVGTPKAGLLGSVAARIVGVPRRAYFLQGLRLEGTVGIRLRVLAIMEWLTSRSSQVVIAVSPSLAARYQALSLNAGRPVVVPKCGSSHGVDSAFFAPRSRDLSLISTLGLEPGIPVLAFIGRLTRDKGPDALFSALESLRSRGRTVQLLVIGAHDEEDSDRYIRWLRDSKLSYVLRNHLEDVRPYLSLADIMVLPTWREGMPNVVLEAAAMEIPAITTSATGAIDAVVHGQTGLIVPVNDPARLAAAIEELLSDEALRMRLGRAARVRVVRSFQPKDVAEAIAAFTISDGDGVADKQLGS